MISLGGNEQNTNKALWKSRRGKLPPLAGETGGSGRRDWAGPGIVTEEDDPEAERALQMGKKHVRKGPEGADTQTAASASYLLPAQSRCSKYIRCIDE